MEQNNVELHINEEPRHDFTDTAMGFGVAFGFFTVVTIVATIISMYV